MAANLTLGGDGRMYDEGQALRGAVEALTKRGAITAEDKRNIVQQGLAASAYNMALRQEETINKIKMIVKGITTVITAIAVKYKLFNIKGGPEWLQKSPPEIGLAGLIALVRMAIPQDKIVLRAVMSAVAWGLIYGGGISRVAQAAM